VDFKMIGKGLRLEYATVSKRMSLLTFMLDDMQGAKRNELLIVRLVEQGSVQFTQTDITDFWQAVNIQRSE